MVTPDLARAIGLAGGVVIALTLLGALAAVIEPSLAGRTPPHPTLTGTVDQALEILQSNARILAVPFLLAILRLPASRAGRLVGDLVVAALTAVSTLSVGIELARWGMRLIPYLLHLPLEWAALSLSLAAWLLIRQGHAPARRLLALAITTAVLLIAAAGVETFATPHRPANLTARQAGVVTPRHRRSMGSGHPAGVRPAGDDLTDWLRAHPGALPPALHADPGASA